MSLLESPTVNRVVRGQLCTGCGLCASLSPDTIKMGLVAPGYSRPTSLGPVSPAAEQKISQTCAGAVVAPWSDAPNIDAYWGPWRRVMTGHAVDQGTRFQGSSGGVISALLIHALISGLVDRVVHVLADPDNPTDNVMTCSTTPAEVLAGAGSRYTASSPLEQMERELSRGGAMAFVGKPCDVSALRRLATIDPRVDAHVKVAVSFFCGGMPSRNGVDRILAAMGVERDDVAAFRYRGQGWPGTAAATTHAGSVVEMSYGESWGDFLSKEVQFRCKICPDAVGGVADIACADAWYGDKNGYPEFEERDGRSLIVSRTERGDRLLEDAIAFGCVVTEPLDLGEIERMQPAQARRKRLVGGRIAALMFTLQPRPDVRGTMIAEAAKRASPREGMRNFLGTIRRILLRRR